MNIVRVHDITPTRWRNEGGRTRELLTWPAHSADWQLRLTLADISQNGPASDFPDVDRWFALASGNGLEMTFPSDQLCLTGQRQSLCFDGASKPDCELIDGPVEAFNFMVSRQTGRGNIQSGRDGQSVFTDAPWRGVFSLASLNLRAGTESYEVGAGSLLWTDCGDKSVWSVQTSPANRPFWWLEYYPHPASA